MYIYKRKIVIIEDLQIPISTKASGSFSTTESDQFSVSQQELFKQVSRFGLQIVFFRNPAHTGGWAQTRNIEATCYNAYTVLTILKS